jgi:ankyrin repeat protein
LLLGNDINEKDDQNQTPLHVAAYYGREAMLMILVKHGAYIDPKDTNGMTPLHLVANKKDPSTQAAILKIIERLVTFGGNINAQMKDGSTPLHLACQAGNLAVAKLLVRSLILTQRSATSAPTIQW